MDKGKGNFSTSASVNLGGKAIAELALRTHDTPAQAARFLYKDAARYAHDEDDAPRWRKKTESDPWQDYRHGERNWGTQLAEPDHFRNTLIGYAGEASDGYLDPNWFDMTDEQLLNAVVPMIMRSGIGTTYTSDRSQEGWWSTQAGGGYTLAAALNRFVQLPDHPETTQPDNMGAAASFIAINAPRYFAQAAADGPLPFGDIAVGVEILLMLLVLSSSSTVATPQDQLYYYTDAESRAQDYDAPIPIPRPRDFDQCQPN
jgi:hypothetical protein